MERETPHDETMEISPPSNATDEGQSQTVATLMEEKDVEVLQKELFDNSLLRLWRTGAFLELHQAEEDEYNDVREACQGVDMTTQL